MIVDEKYKLSSYKEISELAKSSSKKICVVMDEVTNKLYVEKVLSGKEHSGFYSRLASLRHRNLVRIHDVICCDGDTHVYEEYINGQTMKALLESEGVQQEDKAADYIMQVCDALIYLHSQNPPIIYRDIKPENIMISADDVIKLIDFDIAREFKQSAKRDTVFMGTKEYAAPEQYGYKQTDGRTDIYAIGVLLHEMLTGKLPQNNITYKGNLRKIIVKCLRLEPKQRYQSVSALKKALANTKLARYKKIGVCALSAILAAAVIAAFYLEIPGYLYNPNDTSSPQAETEQNVSDAGDLYNLNDATSSSSPFETEQDTDDATSDASTTFISLDKIMGQDYDDLYDAFKKIESFEERPSIILEQKTINDIIRDITGDHYDSVAGAFQQFYDDPFKIFYGTTLFHLPACNTDENGDIHDFLLFIIRKDAPYDEYYYDIDITYYDADLKTTFYFTTNDDKALITPHSEGFLLYHKAMQENPVVFSQPPVTDITGIYYVGYKQKIEIFEESGEMKFSYTDIKNSTDAEPLIVETINKIDDNHYWLKNYSYYDRIMFNFSENRLTIFTDLEDSKDGVYGISKNQYDQAILDFKGVYNKA